MSNSHEQQSCLPASENNLSDLVEIIIHSQGKILIHLYTVEPHLSWPHLSGLFSYPDTCLGTNWNIHIESDSLIRIFSYPDSWLGNEGVRISEAPLYLFIFNKIMKYICYGITIKFLQYCLNWFQFPYRKTEFVSSGCIHQQSGSVPDNSP